MRSRGSSAVPAGPSPTTGVSPSSGCGRSGPQGRGPDPHNMTRAKWQAALEIYRTARELASGDRRVFVDSASADPEVVQQVLELLEAPEEPEAAPLPAPAPARHAGDR